MKRVRTKKPQLMTDTRKRAEANVGAYHQHLKRTARFMTVAVLLAHTHPSDRRNFARGFKDEGMLPKELSREYGFDT